MRYTMLRIGAPLVSWGAASRYRHRETAPDATFSAVAGILAAAAGLGREDKWPAWVMENPAAVRMDQPGRLLWDFHTINPPNHQRDYRWLASNDLKKVATVAKASGQPHKGTVVTWRSYRQDSCLIAAIADPDGYAAEALQSPRWQVYGGRKGCVLTIPLVLPPAEGNVEDVVAEYPSASPGGSMRVALREPPQRLRELSREERADALIPGEARAFARQVRYYAAVDPPRIQSWLDLCRDGVDAATGTEGRDAQEVDQ